MDELWTNLGPEVINISYTGSRSIIHRVIQIDFSDSGQRGIEHFAAQIHCDLAREYDFAAPLTGIGKMMGDRDHTTVMHGIEKIEKEMSAKDSVRNTVDILKKKINPSK